MSKCVAVFSLLIIFSMGSNAQSQDATTPPPAPAPTSDNVQLTVELVDGSRIIGPPISISTLPLKAEFGEVKLPLTLIQQCSFTKDRASLVVKFRNGDQLTGALLLKQIKVKTAFGQATIPIERIGKITVAPK